MECKNIENKAEILFKYIKLQRRKWEIISKNRKIIFNLLKNVLKKWIHKFNKKHSTNLFKILCDIKDDNEQFFKTATFLAEYDSEFLRINDLKKELSKLHSEVFQID